MYLSQLIYGITRLLALVEGSKLSLKGTLSALIVSS